MNAQQFIATTGNGIARATPNGDGAWHVEQGLGGRDVRCLAIDPHNPDVVLAGTQGEGILRSEDRGETWQESGLEGQIVKSIAFSPTPGVVFAGMKPPMVWRSDDGGRSWSECATFRDLPGRPFWRSPAEPPGTAYVLGLAVSPTDPDVVLAGIEFGAVVRSLDGGATWDAHRSGALRDCHTLIFHHSDGQYAYEGGGTGAGGAISRDAGESWSQTTKGKRRSYGVAVAADPADPETWYVSLSPGPMKAHRAGAAEAGIFRQRGDGPWEKLSGGLPDPIPDMPYVLLTDPAAPGHVYAGLRSGEIWHTADYGDTWTPLPVDVGSIYHSLVMWTT